MNILAKDVMVFIDPSSKHYYHNRLFQDHLVLSRDHCLIP